MQFLIRNNTLHMIVTMRSQDAVLGFSYDVFTFSMVAKAIQCLLFERGIEVDMGDLHVNAGSLHVYEQHYDKVLHEWTQDDESDTRVLSYMLHLNQTKNYEDLIGLLWNYAETYGNDHS
jgi:thymidylate synthase